MLQCRHKRERKAVRIMKRVVVTKFMRRAFEQRQRPLKISKWGAWVNREQQRTVSDGFIACAFIFPQTGDATTVGRTEQPRRSTSAGSEISEKRAMTITSTDLEGPPEHHGKKRLLPSAAKRKSSLRKSKAGEKEIGQNWIRSIPEFKRATNGSLPII